MVEHVDPSPPDPDALEDVAYLARSPNRVAILLCLAAGPDSRRTVASETGVSRTTLDRIVNELEERGWAERTADGEYVATPSGRHLVEAFQPFLSSVAAIDRLGDAIAWLPVDELDVGLDHFADAEVRRPLGGDPVETVDYMAELVSEADRFRALTDLVPPAPLEAAIYEGVTAGRLESAGVVTPLFVEYMRNDPDRRERWREMLASGSDLALIDAESVPCNCWIADETVLLKKSGQGSTDESYGVPIVSTDATVREWAHDLVDRYRDRADPVDAEAFVPERQSD